jgi:predicted HicB family RNase H-like nuclease
MPKKSQQCTTPLRLPPDLKEWAKTTAKAQVPSRSLNSWIVEMLERQRACDLTKA